MEALVLLLLHFSKQLILDASPPPEQLEPSSLRRFAQFCGHSLDVLKFWVRLHLRDFILGPTVLDLNRWLFSSDKF
jgi:hypothetical protein